MKIGIITAMGSERSQIERLLANVRQAPGEVVAAQTASPPDGKCREEARGFRVGTFGGAEVALAESGVGKVNAAVGAAGLICRFHPDCIVSTGVAGGIDPSLSVMDVVAGREVVYHDVFCGPGNAWGQVQGLPPRFAGDPALYEKALSLKTSATVRGGLVCSGDQFVTDRAQLAAIKARFPEGLAVEMESGAIAQVCHLFRVPFLSFRIVSDVPGADRHYEQYENFWDALAEKSFGVTRDFLAALAR